MDAAVFVLTADPPLSASERDLLVRVTQASVRTFLVLNKADRLNAVELQDVREFVLRRRAKCWAACRRSLRIPRDRH
jgi:GTP-binding protein EngB required for normal cell division